MYYVLNNVCSFHADQSYFIFFINTIFLDALPISSNFLPISLTFLLITKFKRFLFFFDFGISSLPSYDYAFANTLFNTCLVLATSYFSSHLYLRTYTRSHVLAYNSFTEYIKQFHTHTNIS